MTKRKLEFREAVYNPVESFDGKDACSVKVRKDVLDARGISAEALFHLVSNAVANMDLVPKYKYKFCFDSDKDIVLRRNEDGGIVKLGVYTSRVADGDSGEYFRCSAAKSASYRKKHVLKCMLKKLGVSESDVDPSSWGE